MRPSRCYAKKGPSTYSSDEAFSIGPVAGETECKKTGAEQSSTLLLGMGMPTRKFRDQLTSTQVWIAPLQENLKTQVQRGFGASQRRTHVTSCRRKGSRGAQQNIIACDTRTNAPEADLDRDPRTYDDQGTRRAMSFKVPGTDSRSHGDGVTCFSRRRSRTCRQPESISPSPQGRAGARLQAGAL